MDIYAKWYSHKVKLYLDGNIGIRLIISFLLTASSKLMVILISSMEDMFLKKNDKWVKVDNLKGRVFGLGVLELNIVWLQL